MYLKLKHSILFVGIVIVGGFFYILFDNATAESGVFCKNPVFDFGRITAQNGQFLGRHDFLIENNTNSDITIERTVIECSCVQVSPSQIMIPKRGKEKICVSIYLTTHDIVQKTVTIILVLSDKKIKPLLLKVSGSSGFSVFFEPQNVNFGELYPNVSSDFEVEIFFPAEIRIKNFLKNMKFMRENSALNAQIVEYRSREVKMSESDFFYENKVIIKILLNTKNIDMSENKNNKLFVQLINGEKLEISIYWNLINKSLFEPVEKRYLLVNLQQHELRDFQIIYNEDMGGRLKHVRTTGGDLSVVEHERQDDSVFIKLKYTASKTAKMDEKVGELVVETEDGKTHKLEIIAS